MERGVGTSASSRPVPDGGVDLSGIDCVAGLVRCRGGAVEVSGAGEILPSCRGEKCGCPWRPLGTCAAACVAEGVEIALDEALALPQLCIRADAGVNAVPPSQPVEGRGGCVDDELRCLHGAVFRCGSAPRSLATCVHGCAAEGAEIDGEIDDLRAVRLLCRAP